MIKILSKKRYLELLNKIIILELKNKALDKSLTKVIKDLDAKNKKTKKK